MNDDFKEFLKLLTENEVKYLIIGGYAVSFHSRPRYTDDLDVWIERSADNLEKMRSVLANFGFNKLILDENDFFSKSKIYRIGNPPMRIEIMNYVDGIDFESAFRHRIAGKYGDLDNVNFISLEDLIKNKKASGRAKDNLDLDYLDTYKK